MSVYKACLPLSLSHAKKKLVTRVEDLVILTEPVIAVDKAWTEEFVGLSPYSSAGTVLFDTVIAHELNFTKRKVKFRYNSTATTMPLGM
jgi:hypothetical protein